MPEIGESGNIYKDVYLKERPWLKYYPKGMKETVAIPEISLTEVFNETTDRWGEKTAIVFYGKKISYRELREQVDRFATALQSIGIKKGDTIGLLLLNSPQTIIAFYGALKAGAIITPISPIYTSYEVKHQLDDSGARTVICLGILYETIEKTGLKLDNVIITNLEEYLPISRKILGKSIVGKISRKMEIPNIPKGYFDDKPGIYFFQDLISKHPPKPTEIEINSKEDAALISYTGGTTGLPKGIVLTHYSLMAVRISMFQKWFQWGDGTENLIGYLPMYHIYGINTVLINGILSGSLNIVLTTPDLDDILNLSEKYKASLYSGVPSGYKMLADYDKTGRLNWKRFKFLLSGADSLLEDVAITWKRRTGVDILECYGLTEASGNGLSNVVGKTRIGSAGIPVPNMKAAVINPETTEFLPPGEVGELILQHPSIMKGYWNKPEDEKDVFMEIDAERWLRTGDLFRMGKDGYFYFYDRKADLIKYKGYSVLGREVEEVLTANSKVREAGVIGVPDKEAGQFVKACLVLEREARGKVSEQEIIDWCKERLAHYKIPRIIEFRGDIPKTDIGKVSRRELKEEVI